MLPFTIGKRHLEDPSAIRQTLRRALSSDGALLFLGYCVLVAVKLAWVRGTDGPIVFGDEYLYKDVARSVFSGQGYTVRGVPYSMYPPYIL